ncbi:hypothetical protein [Pseudalkalibacillus caeni]|uniref:Hemerythrin-like domain-containing protein n=1 Tax=Exobacillus caeni TaxID=2574798 RepID=A0A5R9F874_9BACL|nr:hypothetical protein [Pseudalkalibacillus caeni]TLS37828.1 hypothetical protein FCL54_08395 [Pseudalkalibacillus caeni]
MLTEQDYCFDCMDDHRPFENLSSYYDSLKKLRIKLCAFMRSLHYAEKRNWESMSTVLLELTALQRDLLVHNVKEESGLRFVEQEGLKKMVEVLISDQRSILQSSDTLLLEGNIVDSAIGKESLFLNLFIEKSWVFIESLREYLYKERKVFLPLIDKNFSNEQKEKWNTLFLKRTRSKNE